MKILSEKMKVDFNDVVKASSSKPFGFMPFIQGQVLEVIVFQ